MGHTESAHFSLIDAGSCAEHLRRLANAFTDVELALALTLRGRHHESLALLIIAQSMETMFGLERYLQTTLPARRLPAVFAWSASIVGKPCSEQQQQLLVERLHGATRASKSNYFALSNKSFA